ncbi:MAG: TIR domain-containing protein [Fibromonadales bacterium]|nr:TIR domain-containing protein [Fibromonadales bacterium]
MAQRYDIFISYRRKGGVETARLVDIKLREQGYYVSFDIDTLGKGKFTDTLRTRLQGCIDFMVIFEPSYYERFFEPGSLDEKGNIKPDAKLVSQDTLNEDWCYLELKNALTLRKNIIPIIKRDFRFPNNLPPEVKEIAEMNAIEITEKEFKEIFENKVPLYLDSKPKFTHRYKKHIVGVLALIIAGIIAFLVTSIQAKQKEALEAAMKAAKDAERAVAVQDSIKLAADVRAAFVADSMRKENEAKTRGIFDSLAAKDAEKRAASAAASAAASQRKELFWVGNGDETGKILFNKLSMAGLKTGGCSGNGYKVIASSKPNCPPSQLGSVKCSYTPQITITACSGSQVDKCNFPSMNSSGKEEGAARQKLQESLQILNVNSCVSMLQALRK